MLEHGAVPDDGAVDAVVARSWRRSLGAGLMPAGRRPESCHLTEFQLARALDRQQVLLAHARPVMEYLYTQTRDSDSMVILADDRELTRLNRQAMGQRGPTDVLSFPLLPVEAYPAHEGQAHEGQTVADGADVSGARAGAGSAPRRPVFVLPPGRRP